jgi:O-antigen ligase
MPTPINHIRFSIIAAFATYISYHLYIHKFSIFKDDKWLLIIGGFFLFLFVHLFSVRSGIVALYGMIFTEIIIYMIKTKRYKKGILAFLGIIIFAVIVISISPTLKNKISNTQNDLNIYKGNKSPNYSSLTTRFVSYEIAFEIFKENILFGCGLGDINDKNNEQFKEKYPLIITPIIPHNEFIYLLAATGIIGLSIFIFCFFYPLFYKKNYLNRILLMHFIVLFLSFQTEPMIETQLGVAYSIIFIIIPLMEKKEEAIS